MLPGSRHEPPLLQRPNAAPTGFSQVLGDPPVGAGEPAAPQQSLFVRQTSPVGLQPEGGWQTLKPFAPPYGPHEREQQLCSHSDPASVAVPV